MLKRPVNLSEAKKIDPVPIIECLSCSEPIDKKGSCRNGCWSNVIGVYSGIAFDSTTLEDTNV